MSNLAVHALVVFSILLGSQGISAQQKSDQLRTPRLGSQFSAAAPSEAVAAMPQASWRTGPLDLLSERSPWLVDLALWVAATALVVILWLLLAGPAYLVLSIVQRARKAVAEVALASSQAWKARARGLRQSLVAALDPFLAAHELRELQDKPHATWLASLRVLTDPLLAYEASASAAATRLSEAAASVDDASRVVRDFRIPVFAVPEAVDAPVVVDETRSRRYAAVNLILSATFVALLVVVNTGMLSQILRELNITYQIPGTSIQLNYVFAFILTLIEASTGVLHAHNSANRGGTPARLAPQLASLVFAFGLCLMEGLFYSRVGDPEEKMQLPLVGYTLDMEQTFFFLGFALPGVLFLLGHMLYTSLIAVVNTTSAAAAERHIARVNKGVIKTRRALAGVADSLEVAKKSAADARKAMPQVSKDLNDEIKSRISAVRDKLDSVVTVPPEWVSARVERLERSELLQEASRAGTMLVLLIALLVLSIWIHKSVVGDAFQLQSGAASIAALLRGASFLVAGSLLRARPLLYADGAVLRPSGRMGGKLRLTMSAVIGVALIAMDVRMLLAAFAAERIGEALLWSLLIASGVAIVAIGRELTQVSSICLVVLVGLAQLVPLMLGVAHWLAVGTVLSGLLVVEFVLDLVASPASWWVARRRRAPVPA